MRSALGIVVAAAATVASLVAVTAHAGPVAPTVEAFDLADVRLLPSPFTAARDRNTEYLLSLDPDRLLYTFRQNAGLPTPGEPLGGWEKPSFEIRGQFLGHYLTACSEMYRSGGDARFKDRVDLLVAELAKCQDKIGTGYLSAFPASHFDRLETGQRVWAPYYVIHKIMAGLLDANQLCGNVQALDVDRKMAAYFKGRIDRLSDEQMAVALKTEFGGMMEVLANLAAATHDDAILVLAKRFDHHAAFDPLANREDKLAGLHANTQIPKMTGAARVYELTGEDRYHVIPTYFWETVVAHHSFAPGGNSFDEHFRLPGVEATMLRPTTAETCNTYNMLKLTRHLFEWSADVKYADYYERGLFNHILGSIDPGSANVTYFYSLKPGHFKVYSTPMDSFWCCNGTGVENHAKYNDSIYFHDDQALYVNLFIPSEVTWKEQGGVVVHQETAFPDEDRTTLVLKTPQPRSFAIKLRLPGWAARGAAVKVNGAGQAVTEKPGSYVTLDREWHDGDRVEYTVPMSLRLYRPADAADTAVFEYGPVVLAGELGRDGFPPTDLVHDQNELNHVPTPPVPAIVADDTSDPAKLVHPVDGQPLTFTTAAGVTRPDRQVRLIPISRVAHERYTVYWTVTDPARWSAREAKLREEEAARRAEDARIVDAVTFGQLQSETDHNAKSDRSNTGQHLERFWRDAAPKGFFSADLKVLPDVPMTLRCTYWGSDVGRQFDILVDGTKVATQKLENDRPDHFFDVAYPVPPELTKGKETVTVKFQAHDRQMAGGVFGCAMLKPRP